MLTAKQFAAPQVKTYLLALTPMILVAVFAFHSKSHAMGSPLHAELVKRDTEADANIPPVENKKIDANDDRDNQNNVREAIPLWEAKSLNRKSWTEHVYKELPRLGPALLAADPSDAKEFCPNYGNLSTNERWAFWAFFISSIAKFESNFDPKAAYTESFKDNKSNYVISRGLLQISIESSKGYKCGFTKGQELHDPYRNLSCGIKILNHWMTKDQNIASPCPKGGKGWRGGARYWSVLRKKVGKKSYQSIVKWSNGLPFCKK